LSRVRVAKNPKAAAQSDVAGSAKARKASSTEAKDLLIDRFSQDEPHRRRWDSLPQNISQVPLDCVEWREARTDLAGKGLDHARAIISELMGD
jgi:hypothetical protein